MTATLPWMELKKRIEISALLVCKTGVRVGKGGESVEPSATDLPVMRRGDEPFLPGSSLRGVLRSHFERVLRAVEPVENGHYEGKGACDPLHDTSRCVSSQSRGDWTREARGQGNVDEIVARKIWKHSCRACRLFGSPFLASRLRIADAPAEEATVEMRDAVAIDRDKETALGGGKYDFECVTPGSSFRLNITAESLSDEEEEWIAFLISELETGAVRVGGFKGRGLGVVTLKEGAVRTVAVEATSELKQILRLLRNPESVPLSAWLQTKLGG